MKHYTLRILLCLLLGVVTTVGVAWWLASLVRLQTPGWETNHYYYDDTSYYTSTMSGRRGVALEYAEVWFGGRSARPERTDSYAPFHTRDVPSWSFLRSTPVERDVDVNPMGQGSNWREWRFTAGWPAMSLVSQQRRRFDPQSANSVNLNGRPIPHPWTLDPPAWGITIDASGDALAESPLFNPHRTLPLRPVLPGFLINTLFYAAIWLGLFLGFGITKTHIRRRRGACVKCGYDLRGDFESGCPECGWGRTTGESK